MKNKLLYLECASGISGDMTVAALLSLGASRKKLDDTLKSLHLKGYDYAINEKISHSIAGVDFDVKLQHDHDQIHTHRNLKDVYEIIDKGEMSDKARELAKKIFMILAEAESKAHGCSLNEVYFHEVGAIDSIVDIVATAVCFDDLAISNCVVTQISEGFGYVKCRHGKLPVPVPAVVNIAQKYRIPLRPLNIESELVTPTGIAIVAAIRNVQALPAKYIIKKTGIGLGKKDVGVSNLLRAMIITEESADDQVYIIESNIDDSTGEELGFAMEKIFEAGAFDVHFTPCFMKKNRPGWLLRVITSAERMSLVEKTIFRYTTTIGMRKIPVERTCMKRRIINVALPEGDVQVKECTFQDIVRYYPEYESVKKIADKTNQQFRTIFNRAAIEAEKNNQ
ncbi:MAG: nickel pincer cofactor biosynthesis protein LarC [Candidatus Omnitrophica bacterium]|nr:nickel pincer cofactor biosynthesis protein LarC [Candidatus Omnitrophota bacterium]